MKNFVLLCVAALSFSGCAEFNKLMNGGKENPGPTLTSLELVRQNVRTADSATLKAAAEDLAARVKDLDENVIPRGTKTSNDADTAMKMAQSNEKTASDMAMADGELSAAENAQIQVLTERRVLAEDAAAKALSQLQAAQDRRAKFEAERILLVQLETTAAALASAQSKLDKAKQENQPADIISSLEFIRDSYKTGLDQNCDSYEKLEKAAL